ncbi:MAG TPA: cation diffusion facilitator family transporter [Azoarcus sp.]|nr:cation diffusion facilitator family transporter [Azoarcus sp.]
MTGTTPLSGNKRSRGIQSVTLVAVAGNALLAVGQIVVGLFANAFSLVADAVHTVSDLITDLMVLFAGRQGAVPADDDHPYGHGRIETAATLILGAALIAVGVGFLLASGQRLQHMDQAAELHPAALYMAIATLIIKEGLFRFMRAAGHRLNAPLLVANAWHARSDAASSLMVAIGIAGGLAGYPFLEPLAAALVGFLILRMGLKLAWQALRELVDTGLPDGEVARIKAAVLATPGVLSAHALRTRRMADQVLSDVRVRVDPRVTVSEGHRIAERVRREILSEHPQIREVLVHIDAEKDPASQPPPSPLPTRDEITALMATELFEKSAEAIARIQLHYLAGRIEVEILSHKTPEQLPPPALLATRIDKILAEHPDIRTITILVRHAP